MVYGPEPLQFGDLRLPSGSGPHPVVMMIHGGYWQAIYNLTHAGHLCLDLAAHGIATWNVEYRRIGDPGGGWPGALDDVSRALEHLSVLAEDYPLDITRAVVMGHSAGGHLALLVARRAPVSLRAVVSLSGVVDLRTTDSQGDDNGLITRMLGGSTGGCARRCGTRRRRARTFRWGSATCWPAAPRTSIGSRTRRLPSRHVKRVTMSSCCRCRGRVISSLSTRLRPSGP